MEKGEASDNNYEDDEQYEKIGDEVLVHLIHSNPLRFLGSSRRIFSGQVETVDKLCSALQFGLACDGSY